MGNRDREVVLNLASSLQVLLKGAVSTSAQLVSVLAMVYLVNPGGMFPRDTLQQLAAFGRSVGDLLADLAGVRRLE